MREEWVVLVDERDRELGVAPKRAVHHAATPLHRAFSLFLFDAAGRTLAQRRALGKRTWPGIWSNACCGHPGPGEATADAVRRRCREELGIEPLDLEVALPDFRYRAELDGVVENEICPVYVARVDGQPLAADPDEVAEALWLDWASLLATLRERPAGWSPWCIEEAERLDGAAGFREFRRRLAAPPPRAGAWR